MPDDKDQVVASFLIVALFSTSVGVGIAAGGIAGLLIGFGLACLVCAGLGMYSISSRKDRP
jgi:hypothetical protein